ncbi:SRPBCC family protein [Desertivirga arenae]|uniref:SRPBCC family protein n=1 Tax=Desertivirga arenae TaxID=2810309 RepID=UPI001A96CC9A|nr:SRPBCC family protein [Pedobacter sp. SYSU D00823]
MKVMKIVLFTLAVIIALPLIAAIFIKKDYSIKREIIINKPTGEVFNYVKLLKNQEYYSKWVMLDPNLKKQYKGTDGEVGFVYSWEGNDKAGKGEQEIKNIEEGKEVNIEIRFEKPFKGIAYAPITTEAVNDKQTRVTWGMSGKSNYPMNFVNLFNDKMLGGDIEQSLALLKKNLEQRN